MLALITGAGTGIGLAITNHLVATTDYKLALIIRRSLEDYPELKQLTKAYQERLFIVSTNIAVKDKLEHAITAIESQFNEPILGVINNAGHTQAKPFLELTETDLDHMLAVHLKSNFFIAQHTLPAMITAGFGRFIQISSISAQTGGVYQPHYAAAKAGQINLIRSLARLYSDVGITANALAIGLAKTKIIAQEMEAAEFEDRIAAIPAGRLADLEEIAATTAFLLQKEAGYITGQTINLNGGAYMG